MIGLVWSVLLCPTLVAAQCLPEYASGWLNFDHKPGGVCLDGATNAANRQWQGLRLGRNLTIGTASASWSSQEISARIIGILIREKLGVHLEPCHQSYMELSNMWAATAGCRDADSWTCDNYDPTNALYDFVPEFWWRQDAIQANLDVINSGPAANDPKASTRVVSMGSFGYTTSDMLGVWTETVRRARNLSNGALSLDWYTDLQLADAMNYFTPLRTMNISYGLYQYCEGYDAYRIEAWGYKCNSSYVGKNPWRKPVNGQWDESGEMISHPRPLYDCAAHAADYPNSAKKFTDAGFVCRGQGWYLSPSCAAKSPNDEYLDACIPTLCFDPSRSITTLVPGIKELPTVVGIISWWDVFVEFMADYASLYKQRDNGHQNNALMMWWTPDANIRLDYGSSTSDVDFLKVQFTPRLSETLNPVVTIAQEDLLQTSPAVAGLLQKFKMPSDQILKLLDNAVNTYHNLKDSNGVAYSLAGAKDEVACQWLRENKELWEDFIGAKSCWGGTYWLESSGRCLPCPPGTTSERGVTGIDQCTSCPAGTSTGDVAGGLCVPCAKGKFAGAGESECVNCKRGFYSNRSSLESCYGCPLGKSTKEVGTTSFDLCECSEGYYSHDGGCVRCPDKMGCDGFGAFPVALPGYMTWDDTLKPYKCHIPDNCPGGDSCKNGLTFIACGKCPGGENIEDGKCTKCNTSAAWPVIAVFIFALCALSGAYYCLASSRTVKATQILCIGCAMSMTVSATQVYGVFAILSFDWPEFYKDILSVMALMNLDFNFLNVNCAISSSAGQYLNRVFFFITLLVCVPLLALSSQCLPLKWRWLKARTLSLMGSLCSMCFITMVVTSLIPQQCYSHPNDAGRSIAAFPDVLCWDDDQYIVMFLASVVSFAFCIGFYVLCVYLAILAPTSSGDRAKGPYFLTATKFLFARFRVDAWYWGLFLLLRSLSISLIPVMFADSTHAQLIAFAFLFAVFIAAHMFFWPWKIPVLNLVELVIMICLLLSVVTASQPETFNVGLLVTYMILSYAATAVVLVMGITSLIFTGAAGTVNDVFFLSRPPSPQVLSENFLDVSMATIEKGAEEMALVISKLPIYDIQSIAQSLAVVKQCGFSKHADSNTRGVSRRLSLGIDATPSQNFGRANSDKSPAIPIIVTEEKQLEPSSEEQEEKIAM